MVYVNVIGYSVGAMSWYTPDIAHAAAHYRCYTGYHALTDTVLCSQGVSFVAEQLRCKAFITELYLAFDATVQQYGLLKLCYEHWRSGNAFLGVYTRTHQVLSQQRYQTPPIRIKHGAFRWSPYKPELLFYLVFDEYINRSVLLLATEY